MKRSCVYNRLGRRDNKQGAHQDSGQGIDAGTVHRLGRNRIRSHQEWADAAARSRGSTPSPAALPWPTYKDLPQDDAATVTFAAGHDDFARWQRNKFTRTGARLQRRRGAVSLETRGIPPGDITADELDASAAPQTVHKANCVSRMSRTWSPRRREERTASGVARLKALGMAVPNIGLIGNIIACPGGDFCDLANAVSIPVAAAIHERFES